MYPSQKRITLLYTRAIPYFPRTKRRMAARVSRIRIPWGIRYRREAVFSLRFFLSVT